MYKNIHIKIQYTSPYSLLKFGLSFKNECSRMMVKICIMFQLACKQFCKIYFDVNILEKPTVIVPMTISETGTTVTIHCTVSVSQNSPALTAVYWLFNGKNLDISNSNKYSGGIVNNTSLSIKNLASTDAGEYHCGATNLLGSTNSSQSVTLGKIICIS